MSNIDKQGRKVQRYANFGVDMMEWADGGYVKHSDYLALLDELEPMALAHLNLNLLCDVYRSAYEEARHDGLVNWEAASSLAEENEDLKRKLEAAEKRIADLEQLGRGVKQFLEFQICHYGATEDYAKGYIDCQNNYNKVLFAAAGKGE